MMDQLEGTLPVYIDFIFLYKPAMYYAIEDFGTLCGSSIE